MQKIRELFRDYKKNIDRQHELDEMLLIEQSKQDWILGLKKRTEEMQIMYVENEQILQKLEDILSKPLLPEYAEILYEETYDMYWNDYDDCQVLLRLLEVLIPYYEFMQETEKLLFLYGAIYYEENEIQNRRGGTSSISMEYNKKILNYKPYLHSVMVMYLAVALCEETIQKRPDLFCHIPEMSPEELVDFVRKCALLHDVGKIRITDIINTQGRKLWEKEFLAIKMHPEYGAELLAADSDFAKYRDIVLGHHKYYNGKGGYPADFDNTASKYRIIVDLITICDCMDAATDTIGRNYKKNKSIEEVLSEMEHEKGSRYNPDLIEIIVDSKKLIKKMGYIIGEGRMDIMYHAYSEFIGIV